METEELAVTGPERSGTPGRVVEAEITLPKLQDIELPKIDLEPIRALAARVLITGIGVGVLMARAVKGAVRAASEAGSEAAENPGPLTRSLLRAVGHGTKPEAGRPTGVKVKVPVLPIDDSDELTESAIRVRLADLGLDQLRVLREYELIHQARPEILAAIDARLETD